MRTVWQKASQRAIERAALGADIGGVMSDPNRSPHQDKRPTRAHVEARLKRQLDRLAARLPVVGGWLRNLQSRRAALIRIPLALLLIVGGVASILPFLGIWMLPLGLMLLAIDVVALRGPVSGAIIRIRRWWALRQRRRR